jgi:disulfide oxidoreductase YuzD
MGEPGMEKKKIEIKWLREPQKHDYPSAEAYLGLIYDEPAARKYVKKLRRAPVLQFKSKDIFRAAGLPLLDADNSHVAKDQRKVESGEELSPLLLVRDSSHGKVVIADGYHRLCAVYSYDEDAVIPCKIV